MTNIDPNSTGIERDVVELPPADVLDTDGRDSQGFLASMRYADDGVTIRAGDEATLATMEREVFMLTRKLAMVKEHGPAAGFGTEDDIAQQLANARAQFTTAGGVLTKVEKRAPRTTKKDDA